MKKAGFLFLVRAEKVDAFSQWSDRFGIPFIMLSRDKASASRQRFDALHEFAHVLRHRKVTQEHLNNRTTYKILEKHADQFASFMLLPERDFLDELYAPTLDGMLSLKERWGVSIGAMIMRCKSLDILDDLSAKRLWMNYARRRWRKGEPFDGKMEKESPHLIRRCFEMLREANIQSITDIKNALPFPLEDLEELADLEPPASASDISVLGAFSADASCAQVCMDGPRILAMTAGGASQDSRPHFASAATILLSSSSTRSARGISW